MSKVEKFIGEAKISEQPTKKLTWMINDNVVATNHIKDNAVTEPKISGEDSPNGPAVTTAKIADKAVTTSKIQDGAVTEGKISGGLIDGVMTQPAVTTAKIADGAVTSAKISSGAVREDKIASGAVHTENLGVGAVQSIHIAKDAVITEKIFPFAVSEDKIKNYNVTTDKISGSVDPITGEWTTPPAVTENKIAAGAVTATKIEDYDSTKDYPTGVTNDKIADNAVIAGNIAANAVENRNLADDSVTTAKILDGNITTSKILDGNVTTAKLQDYDPNSDVPTGVTTNKIADYNVTEAKLADGAVTTDKLADGLISDVANITDAHPVEGSVKPIQSGGVQEALLDRVIMGDIVGDPVAAWEPGTAEAYIDQRIGEQNSLVNTRINRQDTVIDAVNGTVESIQQAVETLNGNEVVIVDDHTQILEPEEKVIYRQPDTDSYTDWMWDTSATPAAWKDIATYSFPGIDEVPTANSQKLVESGGVYSELALGAVYDISAHHNNMSYADLAAALGTNGNNIPQSLRKGGMSIKYVQTSDNNYVKFFCTADEFTTDVTKWQGVDDEPTAGSDNLVNSGGVIKSVVKNQGLYSVQGLYHRATTGALTTLSGCYSTPFIPIGNKVELYTYLGKSSYATYGIAFFDNDYNYISGYNADTAGTGQGMQKVVLTENEIPTNAAYMTAMLPNGDNLDKAYIFRDNELLQLNKNNYLEGKTYKESSAAIQFVSGLANMPHLTGNFSNTQITDGIEEYIVIRVNGGDAIEIGTGISGSKVAVLADFDVPTKYPYDLIFATGETIVRNIQSGYSATLPSDVKYLLLRSKDATRNFLPQTFKINGYELCSDITEKIIPLTTQVNTVASQVEGVSFRIDGLENTLDIETETEGKTSYYNNTCEYIVGAIKENGGGINTGGSYTSYRSYYFYAPEDGSISIDVGSATWFRMNTGVGTPESLTVKHYGQYGNVENPLPTAQNPWLVSKGDVIVFCALYSVTDFVLTYSYDLVSYVITGASIKMPPKGLLVWNGTYFEFFSKRNDKQYVSFLVKHYKNDNDTVYQDVWSCREAKLYDYTDKSMVFNKDLMNAGGESEFTMLVSGKADHTGGYHGDERLDGDSKCYVKFFAGGREITAADMEDEFSIECDEFSYTEYTTLHETSATSGEYVAGHPIIAYHLKKVTFKDCKNDVENYIRFTTQQSLSRFYSAIACVSKNVATQAVMDGNIDEYNGNTLVASHGTLVQLVGTRHYFRCENPTSKNLIMFNTDNNLKVNLYATMLQGISDTDMTISQIWDRDGGDNDSKWYRNNGSAVTIQSGTIVANHQIIEFL